MKRRSVLTAIVVIPLLVPGLAVLPGCAGGGCGEGTQSAICKLSCDANTLTHESYIDCLTNNCPDCLPSGSSPTGP